MTGWEWFLVGSIVLCLAVMGIAGYRIGKWMSRQ